MNANTTTTAATTEPRVEQFIVMSMADWTAFRWELALKVLPFITAGSLEAGKEAIHLLAVAGSEAVKEWRTVP